MLLFIFYCVQLPLLFYISSQSALTHQCPTLLEFSETFQKGNPGDVSFFCATAGFQYSKALEWEENYDGGKNCCEWDGVTCDSTFRYVIGVDLSCSGLQGILHSNSSLFQLSHLQTLNLAFNDFNFSQIPSKLGQLSSLTHLNLSNSNLGGSVPYEFSYLSKLKSLDLSSYNTISMQEDIWKRIIENHTDMSELALSGVIFSSVPLPSIFMNLASSLTILNFSNCDLTGNYLSISHLPKLQKLDLSENFNLEASLVNIMNNLIGSSIALEILDFSGCALHGKFPTSLAKLTQLTHIDLSYNHFNGPIPPSFGSLTKLSVMDLTVNNFSGSIPASIGNLTQLTHIHLAYNNFNGAIPPSIGNLKQLLYMDLSNNYFKGPLPASIGRLTQLTHIYLSGNYFQDSIPSSIGSLTKLSIVDLTVNNLSGPLPPSVGNLIQLSYMDLSQNNFQGPIPPSIGNLAQLSYMDLSQNNFQGSIPACLGNLIQLSFLDLSLNNLSGLIPSYLFSDLPNLEYLSLSENHLSGSLPTQARLLQYRKLRHLHLSHNYLSGFLPVWCFTLPSIRYLDLSFNQFNHILEFSPDSPSLVDLRLQNNYLQGSIPNSIFDLVDLRILDMSSNNLSGFLDLNMFSKLTNLVQVNISHNIFLSFSTRNIGMEGDFHGALSELQYLDFSYCNISDFPIFLKQAQNLVSLDLSNNNIRGDVPKWFQDVGKDSLETLILSSNYLTRIEMLQWSNLGLIDLSSNSLEGEIPILPMTVRVFLASNNMLTGGVSHSICNLSSLEILDLSHNNLRGMLPQCLGNIAAGILSVLDLQMNNFHGTMPETFMTGAIYLKTLKLGGNKLKGLLPRSLASCKQLEIFDVGHNQIEDGFPDWLEGLPNLQVLVLRDNKFHSFIASPQTEHPFPHLRILDLSNNSFNGPLPAAYIKHFKAMVDASMSGTGKQYMDPNDFGRSPYQDSIQVMMKGFEIELQRILTILTTMDCSNNYFEGEIPQVIGNLKSLIGLNLSHNMLNGSIPPSFANLNSLEWLDLSSNKLTGEIPSNMSLLTFLAVFNVSYNQLTGRIPEGQQFDIYQNSSYIGNNGLCGKPLSQDCSIYGGQSPSSTSDHDDEMEFDWKPVLLGCACGFVFGGSIAYFILSTGKPWWLVKMLLKSNKMKRLYLLIQ